MPAETSRLSRKTLIRLMLIGCISGLTALLLMVTLTVAASLSRRTQQATYPPTVTIQQPKTGQMFTTTHQPALSVQGSAQPGTVTAPVAAVSVTLDHGQSFDPASLSALAWSYNWTLPRVDRKRFVLEARARSSDGALSWSDPVTVWLDTAPPHSLTLTIQPPFLKEDPIPFWLRWGADDGSNITTYDVQYRVGDGSWSDWKVRTDQIEGVFGTPEWLEALPSGSILSFRVRARDGVGNVSGYSTPAETRIGRVMVYLPLTFAGIFQDSFEPNNTIGTAFGPLTIGAEYWSYIWSPTDLDDFYFFELPQNRRVIVTLANIPADADYDLLVYDDNLQLVGSSATAGVTVEQVDLYLTAGTYYARVNRFSGYNNTVPYYLRVSYP
jgi:hypothetical protein